LLLAIVTSVGISLAVRTPFRVDVERDRATLARIVAGGKIENTYRLQIMNAAEQAQRFTLTVEGLPGLVLDSDAQVVVASTESKWLSVRLQLPFDAAAPGSHVIHFKISSTSPAQTLSEKSVFVVPR
jgi:polyferredoxin